MENKYIVIDSIARSGTTLLNSIFNSQENSCSFSGGQSIPYFYLVNSENHKIYYITDIEDKKLRLNDSIKDKIKNSIRSRKDLNNNIQTDKYIELLDNCSTPSDIVDIYYKGLLKIKNRNILCLRWNQTINMFNHWLSDNSNRYWITIIRNPYDRSRSNIKTHQWSLDMCLNLTEHYGKWIEKLKDNKYFNIIYYEDLVENPKESVKILFENIGIDCKNIKTENLIGQNGKEYRNQGCDVKGNRLKGEIFTGIHSKYVGKGEKFGFNKIFIQKMNKIIEKYPCYERYR